jgi:thioesterase domain-containing protein
MVPRDDIEHLVLVVWKRVLNLDEIAVTDDFFELGGHSLLAVRMLNDVKKCSGRAIPLAELFRGATIEHLAKILRGETEPEPHLTLNEIQTKGSRPPFFAVVAPGVNTLGNLALSRVLDPQQPFYQLQGAGAELIDRPYTDLEIRHFAEDYVRVMRSVQPQGPYFFGGMCEGTRIAFQMARVLESQGQATEFLASFDTWAVENAQIRWLWLLNYYQRRIQKFLNRPRFGGWSAAKRFLRRKARRLTTHESYNKKAWHDYYWPGKSFVPEQVNARITVFKIPSQFLHYRRDPSLGWAARTTVGVDVHLVKARHLQMLREPWVRNLGVALDACLRRAQAQSTGHAI